jgi:hypothetical protein
MAGTTTKSRQTAYPGSTLRALVVEFNKVVNDLETLRAGIDSIADKLDVDGQVTATDYASGAACTTAAAMTAAKIGNAAGTAIT